MLHFEITGIANEVCMLIRFKRFASRLRLLPAALSVVVPIAGAEAQSTLPAPASWYAGYQRDSRLIVIGRGRSLNLYCLGSGSPTVILEAGIGSTAFDWWAVHRRMAERTRVCAYERAGLGRSPPGPLPRDTRAEVADLEALVRAARLRPPYVLVGHSMGAYNVRVFASRHRRDVAGMVLVDPSVENQIPLMHAAAPAIAANDERQTRRLRACADAQRTPEIARLCTRPAPAGFPPDLAAAYVADRGLIASQAAWSEAQSFLSVASEQVIAERRPLGALPLIVLTRGQRSSNLPADQAEAEWLLLNRLHDEVARLSTIGINRVVPGADHYIQFDRPEAVIAAVGEVVSAARGGAGAPRAHDP